jgi:hypothetical protein
MRERNLKRVVKPLGLNAVGRPFSENFDPSYKLQHKTSYGHLRLPYGPTMKFIGDDPEATESRRQHYRRPKPAPLLDGLGESAAELNGIAAIKLLQKIERKLDALRQAMLRGIERVEHDLGQARKQLDNSGAVP